MPDVAAQMRHSVLPLLDFQGRPAGSCSCAAWLPCRSGRQQAPLRLQDLETPVSQCTLAAPDELPPPLERLGSGGGLPFLVMDGGLLGRIISAHDIQPFYQRNAPDGRAQRRLPAAVGGNRPGIDV
ncbi:hypothetical protein [Streptomyces sp. NPDC056242]|uniref:hypothetical protein n=1 Tax=unclassified Streptomyces TaxID=2593676 RepID=UPI0035E03572